jgi:hypothetical protein
MVNLGVSFLGLMIGNALFLVISKGAFFAFSSLLVRSSFAICSLQGWEKSIGSHRANVEQMRL